MLKTRRLTSLIPAGGRRFFVHNYDVTTIWRGIVERKLGTVKAGSFCPYQDPKPGAFTKYKRYIKVLTKGLSRLTAWDAESVIECFDGAKKRLYIKADESLVDKPLTRKDFQLSVFVKYEPLDATSKPVVEHKPRIICVRSYRAALVTACYIKPAERVLYKLMNKRFKNSFVVKGLNVRERGEQTAKIIDRIEDPYVLVCDASHADSSVGDAHRNILFRVLSILFRDDPVVDILRQYYTGHQVIKTYVGGVLIEVKATELGLSSGDSFTSLVMNLLMCFFYNHFISDHKLHAVAIIDGDDTSPVVRGKDVPVFIEHLQAFFSDRGFNLKIEAVRPLNIKENFQHCQSRLIWERGWVMCRHPGRCLSKDSKTIQPINNKSDYDYYRDAKSKCGLALCGGVPLLGAFYEAMGRGANPKKRKVEWTDWRHKTLARGLRSERIEPDAEARLSFYLAFDITPDEQRDIEKLYDNLSVSYSPPVLVDEFSIIDSVSQLVDHSA